MLRAVLVVAALSAAAPVFAAGKPDATVALFIAPHGDPDRAIVKAAVDALQELATRARLRLLAGPALKKRLGAEPRESLLGCGGKLDCLAELGKKANARELLVARAIESSSGSVELQLSIVDGGTGATARRVTVTLTSVGEVRQELWAAAETIFATPEAPAKKPPASVAGAR
jgi:hypothetical protein